MNSLDSRSPDDPTITAPRDLADDEADLAGWFSHLDRPDAPPGLRARLLVVPRVAPRGGRGLLRHFPLGAWGLASAVLLLLALGSAAAIDSTSPVEAPVPVAAPAQDLQGQVRIREDGTLTLFHDVETFDEVGLSQGELIADWGR